MSHPCGLARMRPWWHPIHRQLPPVPPQPSVYSGCWPQKYPTSLKTVRKERGTAGALATFPRGPRLEGGQDLWEAD